MVNFHGRFAWYELVTTDVEAAKAFYTNVMGWGALDASVPGRAYTLFTAGNASVSGLMDLPEDARQMGANAELARICRGRRRGRCRRPDRAPWRSRARPTDGRSRHQPLFDLHRPANRKARVVQVAGTRPRAARRAGRDRAASAGTSCSPPTGKRRWLSTASFSAGRRADADVGEMGTYQLFSAGGQTIGGMLTKPPTIPAPVLALLFQRRRPRRGGAARRRPVAARSSTARLKCRAAAGSSNARTRRAPCSRWREARRKAVGYFERASRDPSDTRAGGWSGSAGRDRGRPRGAHPDCGRIGMRSSFA